MTGVHAGSRRALTTSDAKMVAIRFSEGASEASLATEANRLMQKERPWKLCADGQGIERTFKFKTFKAAWVCGRISLGLLNRADSA